MNPDRHIYLATVVIAVVFATAVNVFKTRDPLPGATMHRESPSASASASPPSTARQMQQAADVAIREAAPQRAGAAM